MSAVKNGIGLADPTPLKLLKAALGYAKYLNWPVIPLHSIIDGKCTCGKRNCQSPGKHPRFNNWQEAATTDRDTIIRFWKRWPNSNIGILTGKKSGFFVLDIDIKDSLEQITYHYGKLPDTVEQITGSKGSHYLFKYQNGIKNKVGLFPGIDIRGEGGFIVVSPSVHKSGNQYQWELSSHPLEVPIADAPRWLLDMIVKPKDEQPKAKPSSYWVDLFNNTCEGNRNNAAASLAGYLFKRYVDPFLVVEIMHLWNKTRVKPPLDEKELNTVINSIAGKELARRRGGKK